MGAGHAGHPAAVRVRQLEERVIAAGLATDAELDATLARLYAHASPLNGSRIVARAWAECGAVTSSDRYLVVTPFFHNFGFKAGLLVGLLSGATLVPQLVYDAERAMRQSAS